MTNAYSAILQYDGTDWEGFLEGIMLFDVFKPLLELYKDADTRKCAIRYILYAYSVQSEKILLGTDWGTNKKKIFEEVYAKPVQSLLDELVYLKESMIVEAIMNWLDYQDSDVFKTIQTLKDLRSEMLITSVGPIIAASGMDYDQKFKNSEYALKLRDRIKDLEAELVQNNPKLKDQVKEARQAQSSITIGPGTFSK